MPDRESHRPLFAPAVSITMTKRRRFFWAAWWSAAPTHVPFTKPDASDGGAATFEEAHAAAEARAGEMKLGTLDPLWARAWIRILRGEAAWPSKASRAPATTPRSPRTGNVDDDVKTEAESIWTVLGVSRDVSATDLKAAYRKRVLETHPDQGGTEEQFERVMRAYAEAQRRIKKPKSKRA